MNDPWKSQMEALGSFIRTQRKLADLSLRELAEMTEVSNPYLSQLERGLHQPSVRVLKSIANALNVSAETLLVQAGLLEDDVEAGEAATARSRARPAGRRSSRTAPRQHRATPSTAPGITAGEPASASRPITTGRTIPPSWPAENTMAVEVRDPGATTASQASTVGNTGPRASPVRA